MTTHFRRLGGGECFSTYSRKASSTMNERVRRSAFASLRASSTMCGRIRAARPIRFCDTGNGFRGIHESVSKVVIITIHHISFILFDSVVHLSYTVKLDSPIVAVSRRDRALAAIALGSQPEMQSAWVTIRKERMLFQDAMSEVGYCSTSYRRHAMRRLLRADSVQPVSALCGESHATASDQIVLRPTLQTGRCTPISCWGYSKRTAHRAAPARTTRNVVYRHALENRAAVAASVTSRERPAIAEAVRTVTHSRTRTRWLGSDNSMRVVAHRIVWERTLQQYTTARMCNSSTRHSGSPADSSGSLLNPDGGISVLRRQLNAGETILKGKSL